MTQAGKKPEIARKAALHRTIPNHVKTVAVNTTATQDMASVTATDGTDTTNPQSLLGLYIWLAALTADITILRKGTAPGAATVGLVLTAGAAPLEVFIDPDGLATLAAKSAASATLVISWDSEQAG